MNPPTPTPIFRFFHVRNLPIILRWGGFHAPNLSPDDGEHYTTIHSLEIQRTRRVRRIPCGRQGVIHDYVPFYFGPRSPMLYQLHTGWVEGYQEGQQPLIYAVTTAQAIEESGLNFVFSDGHGVAAITRWFDNLEDLVQVDWQAAHAKWWRDTVEDMDLQRRKQAEFLVHRFCPWDRIQEVGVIDSGMREEVKKVLAAFPESMKKPVRVQRDWYY